MLKVEEHKNVEKVIRYYISFLPPRGVESILDIGCGITAPYSGMLKTRCKHYGSLDILEGPKVQYVYDLAKGTPFKNKEWEWGWCVEVLEHIDPILKEATVDEIMRICRNCVFTYPLPSFINFADDPGHTEVKIDWNKFTKTHTITNKTTKTGRAILILTEKNYKPYNYQSTLL